MKEIGGPNRLMTEQYMRKEPQVSVVVWDELFEEG